METNSTLSQPNVLETAARLHRAGADLLGDGLEALLGGYGRLTCTGSFYMDLMAWPDLDLYVPLEKSADALARFLELAPGFATACRSSQLVSLRFKDFRFQLSANLPQGLYWGVRCLQTVGLDQDTGLDWKLDIWALPAEEIAAKQAELERLKGKLTPERRRLILEIKHALLTPEGRTPALSGYPIYRAVLDQGLRSVEAVEGYLRETGVLG
jgi:hypothetical protein